jgi:hypothetical protein
MDSGRGPNPNSAKRNRKTHVTALSDEAIIKQLKVAIDSQEIWQKALDVLHKRIASRELSDNMLLRPPCRSPRCRS